MALDGRNLLLRLFERSESLWLFAHKVTVVREVEKRGKRRPTRKTPAGPEKEEGELVVLVSQRHRKGWRERRGSC